MIYYYVLSLLLFLISLDYLVKENKVFYLCSFIILWIVASIRYNVGADYLSYLNHMNTIKYQGLSESYFEPGFYFIVQFIKFTGMPDVAFFAISSFLTLFFVYISGRERDKFKILIIYFFICYLYSLVSVRQALAIAIILYSHTLLFNNKTKKSMFFFSLSMFWHKSAVLAFLFMGLYFLKANRIKVTALLFMGLVLIKTVSVHSLIMSIPFIDSLPFSHHLHSELFKPPGLGSGLGVLVKLSLPLVSMFFILTFLNENKDRKLDYIFKINVLVLFFTVLATEITIVNRVTLLLYYIIPLSYVVIRSSLVKAIHKHFFDLSFISCCLVFFIMTVQFGKGTYQILPYTTFL